MLGDLQQEILALLSASDDGPVLFGGGAIISAYTQHRTTHDLDLAWSPADDLREVVISVGAALSAAGLVVERLQTSPRFIRLRVARADGESTVVDLIAEPRRRPRIPVQVGASQVWVPPVNELLADKLCALLSRQEGRDLWDATELLGVGADLGPALTRAAELDSGFSPLTLAWVLRSWPMQDVGVVAGWGEAHTLRMDEARQALVGRLVEGVSE